MLLCRKKVREYQPAAFRRLIQGSCPPRRSSPPYLQYNPFQPSPLLLIVEKVSLGILINGEEQTYTTFVLSLTCPLVDATLQLRRHETLAGPSTQSRGILIASGVNGGQTTARGSGAHATTGRAEHAAGATVGSNAKAGGSRRPQCVHPLIPTERHTSKKIYREANEANIQRQELAEAERLEREALAHRERAVAHGAHRANRYLGGDPRAGILQEDGNGGQRGFGTRRSGGPCDTSPGYRSQQQPGAPGCAGQCGRDSCNAKKRATTSERRSNVCEPSLPQYH
jgi:hypothetical protein